MYNMLKNKFINLFFYMRGSDYMEETITIAELNDFIFCPMSIYFHGLYGNIEKIIYQDNCQLAGTKAHETIDDQYYSSKKDILQGISVYSSTYNILGKIDIFDIKKGTLIERKNSIKNIYDGYIFQVYAQYFALKDMGYNVSKIKLYSMIDNKNYNIDLPENNKRLLEKFEETLNNIKNFNMDIYYPTNKEKCENCIYRYLCDRSQL